MFTCVSAQGATPCSLAYIEFQLSQSADENNEIVADKLKYMFNLHNSNVFTSVRHTSVSGDFSCVST